MYPCPADNDFREFLPRLAVRQLGGVSIRSFDSRYVLLLASHVWLAAFYSALITSYFLASHFVSFNFFLFH